jgi:GAF domain-containing protein
VDLSGDNGIGIMGRAVKAKKSQRVGNVRQNPDYIEYNPDSHSELAVPINLEGEVIGVINVEHKDVDAFDAANNEH